MRKSRCKEKRVPSKVVKVRRRMENNKTASQKFKKFSHLCHDPDFKDFLNEVLDERENSRSTDNHPVEDRQTRRDEYRKNITKGNNGSDKVVNSNGKIQNVKSPSDTTIYSPGLRKMSNDDVSLMEKISNFVESIRLDGKNRISRPIRDQNDTHGGESSFKG